MREAFDCNKKAKLALHVYAPPADKQARGGVTIPATLPAFPGSAVSPAKPPGAPEKPLDAPRGAEKSSEEASSETGDRVVLSAVARLTPEQQRVVAQLAEIDRRVRAHEQAHLAAAGGYARGAPTFTFVTGPDGKQYAVGGGVSIDSAPVQGDPEATIRKARAVQAAANAPADPSSQDRQVAAAGQMEIQARIELAARWIAAYRDAQEQDSPPLPRILENLLA